MSDSFPSSANQPPSHGDGNSEGAAVSQAPPAPAVDTTETRHRFAFSGKGGEYFGIWIVNILLSIITIGIYSAWAKVRRLQYFHRNTQVAGSSFDFHARPIDILKGRLIAFGAYLAFIGLSKLSVTASVVLALLLFAVIPYFAYKSLRFRYRNSSWRQIRFNFRGKVPGAYGAFFGWPLAALFSAYTLVPISHHQATAYTLGNAALGATPAAFSARIWDFYKVYFKTVGLFLLLMLLVAAPIWLAASKMSIPWKAILQSAAIESPQPYSALAKQPTAPIETEAKAAAETANAKDAGEAKEPDEEEEKQDDDAAAANIPPYFKAMFPLLIVGFYLFAFLAIGPYFSARIGNVIWNGTRLGPMRFESTLSARRLSFITITNWLGIIFTLGFFKPFAAVRMAKYRAESLCLVAVGPIAVHAQVAAGNVNARGEEIAEMFDVDIGL
jgi:uncharacterized membrane protein YjgN (DUF898 family)